MRQLPFFHFLKRISGPSVTAVSLLSQRDGSIDHASICPRQLRGSEDTEDVCYGAIHRRTDSRKFERGDCGMERLDRPDHFIADSNGNLYELAIGPNVLAGVLSQSITRGTFRLPKLAPTP
jgi:hypothetical protein